jgi:hypothetical protein
MLTLDQLAQDFRVAVRGLTRRPVFFAVAAFTLAVGIGANTAIFSVVNGVLLRPLPYPAADEIVLVNVAPNDVNRAPGSMSYPDLADLRQARRLFSSLVGVNATNMTLTGIGSVARDGGGPGDVWPSPRPRPRHPKRGVRGRRPPGRRDQPRALAGAIRRCG